MVPQRLNETKPYTFVAIKRLRPPDLGEALMNRRKLTELFEKFMVAVDVLATSPAPIQKQLEGAFKSFVDVKSKDFDDTEMQATFEQIRSRLTRGQHRQANLSLRAAGKCLIRRLQK